MRAHGAKANAAPIAQAPSSAPAPARKKKQAGSVSFIPLPKTVGPRHQQAWARRLAKDHVANTRTAIELSSHAPDLVLDDPGTEIDKKVALSKWKAKRKLYSKELLDLAIEHMALSSAIDTLAEIVPRITDDAATVEASKLQQTLAGAFSVAYLEMLGRLLNLSKATRAGMLRNLNARLWGPAPSSPVTVTAGDATKERKRRSDSDRATQRPPGPVAFSRSRGGSKTSEGPRDAKMPAMANPFGHI